MHAVHAQLHSSYLQSINVLPAYIKSISDSLDDRKVKSSKLQNVTKVWLKILKLLFTSFIMATKVAVVKSSYVLLWLILWPFSKCVMHTYIHKCRRPHFLSCAHAFKSWDLTELIFNSIKLHGLKVYPHYKKWRRLHLRIIIYTLT